MWYVTILGLTYFVFSAVLAYRYSKLAILDCWADETKGPYGSLYGGIVMVLGVLLVVCGWYVGGAVVIFMGLPGIVRGQSDPDTVLTGCLLLFHGPFVFIPLSRSVLKFTRSVFEFTQGRQVLDHLTCFAVGHDWHACRGKQVCRRCSREQDCYAHVWDGCVCRKCGQHNPNVADSDHSWRHGQCYRCQIAHKNHIFEPCICTICGAVRHDWEEVETWDDDDYETRRTCTVWTRYRCRRCGAEDAWKTGEIASYWKSWDTWHH
jgi:hypothetical protein